MPVRCRDDAGEIEPQHRAGQHAGVELRRIDCGGPKPRRQCAPRGFDGWSRHLPSLRTQGSMRRDGAISAEVVAFLENDELWLWVPAFAGTTPDLLPPLTPPHPARRAGRPGVRWSMHRPTRRPL